MTLLAIVTPPGGRFAAKTGLEAIDEALRILPLGGGGRNPMVRMVGSADELETWFARMTQGGTLIDGTDYPGRFLTVPGGGAAVGIRPRSLSGGATIDIFMSDKVRSHYTIHIDQ